MTSSTVTSSRYPIPNFFENWPLRTYLANLQKWQGYIRFLGLPDRRDNPDVAIDRLFVAPLLTRRYVSPDENPKVWTAEAETMIDAIEVDAPLVLLGDPGIGKSTLLNQLACLLSRPARNPLIDRHGWRLPLLMVLRELPVRGVTDFDGLLEAFLSREMSAPLRDDEGRRYLKRTLAEGNAFLLLDGIDEIGDRRSREDLREAVFDGIARFPDCRWLLSSRIVGYDEVPFDRLPTQPGGEPSRLRRGSQVREEVAPPYRRERHPSMRGPRDGRIATRYIAPFDDPRIATFARNWYHQRDAAQQRAASNANHLIRAVHADDSILRLARVPNLLTMMALIHRIEATLPHGRALLYERIAEAYLESIDKFRGIDSSPHDLPRKKGWLARVGFEMQRRRTSENRIDRSEILVDYETVLDWLSEEMERSDAPANGPSARGFLRIVGRRSGLFLPRGEGRYAFVHLSFQEYFAAVALAREVTRLRWARGKESRLEFDHRTVANWACESIWRETFTFLFELLASEEEDDWHAELLDCVFGDEFSRLNKSETDEETSALGHLLARLVVNSRSGLSQRKREIALAHCVSTQLQKNPRMLLGNVFDTLLSDDVQLNERVFREIEEQIKKSETRFLDLSGVRISDLSPLSSFTEIQSLDLMETQISNLSSIMRLINLRSLNLMGTQVSDLSPLENLTMLTNLNLIGTPVFDFTPILNLRNLQSLELGDIKITTLDLLSNLPKLESLTLAATSISDISPLTKFPALCELEMIATDVSDLSPLAKLTTLRTLSCFDVPILDLSPLSRLPSFESLQLEAMDTIDLSQLSNMSSLHSLYLYDIPISDLAPLANLTTLRSLTLSIGFDVNPTLSPLANLSDLQELYLYSDSALDLTPLVNLISLKKLDLGYSYILINEAKELRNSRPDIHITIRDRGDNGPWNW